MYCIVYFVLFYSTFVILGIRPTHCMRSVFRILNLTRRNCNLAIGISPVIKVVLKKWGRNFLFPRFFFFFSF